MKFNKLTQPETIGVEMARKIGTTERVSACAPHYYATYRNLHGEVRQFIEKHWDGDVDNDAVREKTTYALISYLHTLYATYNHKTIEEDQYGQKPFV